MLILSSLNWLHIDQKTWAYKAKKFVAETGEIRIQVDLRNACFCCRSCHACTNAAMAPRSRQDDDWVLGCGRQPQGCFGGNECALDLGVRDVSHNLSPMKIVQRKKFLQGPWAKECQESSSFASFHDVSGYCEGTFDDMVSFVCPGWLHLPRDIPTFWPQKPAWRRGRVAPRLQSRVPWLDTELETTWWTPQLS